MYRTELKNAFLQSVEAFLYFLFVFFFSLLFLNNVWIPLFTSHPFLKDVFFIQVQESIYFSIFQDVLLLATVIFSALIFLFFFKKLKSAVGMFFSFLCFFSAMPFFLSFFSLVFSPFFPIHSFIPFILAFLSSFLVSLLISYIFASEKWLEFGKKGINLLSLILSTSACFLLVLSLSFNSLFFIFFILSIYDVFAVFFSKHMIALAKGAVEHNLPLLLFGGNAKRRFILGTGDVVLPCAFALSAFYLSPFLSLVLFFSIPLALFFLFSFLQSTKRVLPALPFFFLVHLSVYLIFSFFPLLR